jgi:hypothetical protein
VVEDREPIHRRARIEHRRQRHPRPLIVIEQVLVTARDLEIHETDQSALEAHYLSCGVGGTEQSSVGPRHHYCAGDLVPGTHPGGYVLLVVIGSPRRVAAQGRAESFQRL